MKKQIPFIAFLFGIFLIASCSGKATSFTSGSNEGITSISDSSNSITSNIDIDTEIQNIINKWLSEHPEATTTVQDGSITSEKLSEYLKNEIVLYTNDLNELKSALNSNKKFIVLKSDFYAEVSEMIALPEGTTIIGNNATFKRATGYEGMLFHLRGKCELSDITIDGNRYNMINPTWDSTIECALRGSDYIHDIQFVDANEAVVAFGDFNRIEHCEFTNCGGNAVHFSGGVDTVVDGCFVRGANKRVGMGHEDGCIIWSNECTNINCINNYCEDGLTGFGSIDTFDNSYVKIVNNTIKNCINSFDLVTKREQAVDVLIEGNLIINSGKLEMNKTAKSLTAQARYMICNNTFVESSIEVIRLDTISILGNIILDGIVHVVCCTNVKVENNSIKNYTLRESTITCGECANVSILGNYVRGDYDVVNCYGTSSFVVSNNKIRSYSTDVTKKAIHTSVAQNAANNEIISYNNGVEIGNYYSFTNNTIYLKDTSRNSMLEYSSSIHSLVAFNRTNGVDVLYDDNDGNQNIGNMKGEADDLFLNVSNNLTNINTNGLDSVFIGDDYVAVLTPKEGYALPDKISVSMGGVDEPGDNEFFYDKQTGKFVVFGVTSNLTINAEA